MLTKLKSLLGIGMTEDRVRQIVIEVLQERGLVTYDPATLDRIAAQLK